MNQNLTELVVILDMSGSMRPLWSDTIGGFNALVEEQKKAEGDAILTTVFFDDRYIVFHDREDIQKVALLTDRDYRPRGMTAMLDAVGRTITSVGERLAQMPEEERPGKVMVTIVTDGYENASKEYTWDTVQAMIKEQREKYSWIFTFIGADIDVKKVSEDLGIDSRLAKTYTKSSAGTASVYHTVAKAMSYRRSSVSNSVSESACVDSLSEILDDIE